MDEDNMPRKVTIAEFENDLEGLQGVITYYARNNELEMLFDVSYPRQREILEEVKPALEKIDMYEPVSEAIRISENLAREGKFEEASDVVLEINRALMKASGTWDKIVKHFRRKEDKGDASA